MEAEEAQGPLTFPSPLLTLTNPLHFPQHRASGPEHPLQTPRPAPEPAPPGFHWPFHPTAHKGPHSPLEVSGPGRPSHTSALSCNPG